MGRAYSRYCLMTYAGALALSSGAAHAQTANADSAVVSELVVTAQKRSESINQVAMSVVAATGEQLADRGITNVADLTKIVPGFVFRPNPLNAPIYMIRGVGFYEPSLASTPTVSVYTDEVPLPFPSMTRAAALDLERVEVLKGPQGTLFGQNSTGGAINYISAKPRDTFASGFEASYGRFSTIDVTGFVTGPIAQGLTARISARVLQGDGWQKSYTRDDNNAKPNQIVGRILLQWTPSEALTVLLNVNGWRDRSEPQAPQISSLSEVVPGRGYPSVVSYPISPRTPRAADWSPFTTSDSYPGLKTPQRDDKFYQAALRGDYRISDTVSVTSITAYERYDTFSANEVDGMNVEATAYFLGGRISSFSQELRVSGETARLKWIVGANYQDDTIFDHQLAYVPVLSNNTVIPGLPFRNSANFSDQDIKARAVFANAEFALTDQFSLQAAARYTKTDRDFAACANAQGDAALARTFEFLQAVFKGPGRVIPIGVFDCLTLNTNLDPALVVSELNEDNVSWRAGANWKFNSGALAYANISKGYKSGGFPTNTAATSAQYVVVTQESVLAYEAGLKTPLLDRRVQLNGAVFYYDYKDKQFLGNVRDPVFGPLGALVNIPKSRVKGAELAIVAQSAAGLTVSVSGSYVDGKVQRFVGINAFGQNEDFGGSRFPLAPRYQAVADVQYTWPIRQDDLHAFVGGSATYASATNSALGYPPELRIPAYGLLDLRAGLERDNWRLSVWGRNVANAYYFTQRLRAGDHIVDYAGMPATYGVSLRYRFD